MRFRHTQKGDYLLRMLEPMLTFLRNKTTWFRKWLSKKLKNEINMQMLSTNEINQNHLVITMTNKHVPFVE